MLLFTYEFIQLMTTNLDCLYFYEWNSWPIHINYQRRRHTMCVISELYVERYERISPIISYRSNLLAAEI